MSKPIRICFLADRHDLYDDRIYWKMAVPLIKEGFEVHYLLISEKEERGTTSEGVHFKTFKLKTFSGNRFLNFLLKRLNPGNNYQLMFKEAKVLKADIYHFHDLWINRIGPDLKNLDHNPVVFYDAREPYAEDYLSYVKTKFPVFLKLFAKWVNHWEKKMAKNYNLVIANELNVQQNFAKVIGNERSIVLYNYTDFSKESEPLDFDKKKYDLIYCGAVTKLRGALIILNALKLIKKKVPGIKMLFLGNYFPGSLQEEMQNFIVKNDLSDIVELKTAVPYTEVSRYYRLSKIGLVLWQKVRTFEIKMPIKIFEYMAYGLPIVGSNFGHIKNHIEKDACGIAVDSDNPEAIAKAVLKILTDQQLYNEYSRNGKNVSREKYRWEFEFTKLLHHYKKALNER